MAVVHIAATEISTIPNSFSSAVVDATPIPKVGYKLDSASENNHFAKKPLDDPPATSICDGGCQTMSNLVAARATHDTVKRPLDGPPSTFSNEPPPPGSSVFLAARATPAADVLPSGLPSVSIPGDVLGIPVPSIPTEILSAGLLSSSPIVPVTTPTANPSPKPNAASSMRSNSLTKVGLVTAFGLGFTIILHAVLD